MRILLNLFSEIIPTATRNSRCFAVAEWESPDLRVTSEMFSSPLSRSIPSIFVLP